MNIIMLYWVQSIWVKIWYWLSVSRKELKTARSLSRIALGIIIPKEKDIQLTSCNYVFKNKSHPTFIYHIIESRVVRSEAQQNVKR